MTKQKSFKRLVRRRMEKTGESYTTARAMILAASEPADVEVPQLVASDEVIRRRTGRGWEEWFDLLDSWGALERTHRDISTKVAAELGIDPLAWNAQAVTTSYERARGVRAVGQRADGLFAASASKTVGVAVVDLFDAFVDDDRRGKWLSDDRLSLRTATRHKTARFDWGDDGSRVLVTFNEKSATKGVVSVEHTRLADDGVADEMRTLWRSGLERLKEFLENG